jgi:hypothetical protein
MLHNPEHDEAPPPFFYCEHEYDDCHLCRRGVTGFPFIGALIDAEDLPSNYEGYGPPDDS